MATVAVEDWQEDLEQDREVQEEQDQVVLDQVVLVLEAMELGLEELVQVVLDQEALFRLAKAQAWSFFLADQLISWYILDPPSLGRIKK